MPRYRKLLPRRVDSGGAHVRDLRNVGDVTVEPASEDTPTEEPAAEPLSYRDLQQQAIALGINGRQTREELEAAIAEAEADE